MAPDTTVDVAEIADLDLQVVADEQRAHSARKATRPSRAFAVWGAALLGLVMLGAFGRLLEPPHSSCCPGEAAAATSPGGLAARPGPATGHSALWFPAGEPTTISLEFVRGPGPYGTNGRLRIGGLVEGPAGNVVIELVSGSRTIEQVTRSTVGPTANAAPTSFGVFSLTLAIPSGEKLRDLWIVATAYLDGRQVAVANTPVDPPPAETGPNKYVLDDVVDRAATSSAGGNLGGRSHIARGFGVARMLDSLDR